MIDAIRPDRFSADAFLAGRRARLERRLGCRLVPPPATDLPASHRRFLREEAEELYWNELCWAIVVGSGPVGSGWDDGRARGIVRASRAPGDDEGAELAFAAFLTFIDGLLLRETRPGFAGRATPRPGVVEEILGFLCERCLDLAGAERDGGERVHALTERLIDLVLYRLHAIPTTARDAGRPPGAGDSGPARVGEDG